MRQRMKSLFVSAILYKVTVFPIFAAILVFSLSVSFAEDCEKARMLFHQASELTDYHKKLPLYQEAVNICADYATAWNNLADAEEHLDLLNDAIAHYQKAISIDPDLAESHFGLGDIYLKQKEFHKALDKYLAGLRIKPGDELTLQNLKEVESGIQSSGGVLPSYYIAYKLNLLKLMGVGGARPRLAFQNILFDFDSDRLRPESYAQLDEIGSALQELAGTTTIKFLIEGHTDNKGSYDYNMTLSERRANSVRRHLVSRFGLDPERLQARGLGYTMPAATNDTPEGRAINRRVEIAVAE